MAAHLRVVSRCLWGFFFLRAMFLLRLNPGLGIGSDADHLSCRTNGKQFPSPSAHTHRDGGNLRAVGSRQTLAPAEERPVCLWRGCTPAAFI